MCRWTYNEYGSWGNRGGLSKNYVDLREQSSYLTNVISVKVFENDIKGHFGGSGYCVTTGVFIDMFMVIIDEVGQLKRNSEGDLGLKV